MKTPPALTDELIQQAFARRASRGQPEGVYDRVVAAVAVTPQRGGIRVLTGRGTGSGLRLLAVAVLVAGALAGVAIVGGDPVTPTPARVTRTVSEFVQPFEFRDDTASGLSIRFRTPSTIAFADVNGYTGYSPTGYPETPDGAPIAGSWGIVLSGKGSAWTYPCRGIGSGQPGEMVSANAPDQLLDELRARAGVGLGVPSAASIDGYPGLAASIDPDANECADAGLYMRRPQNLSGVDTRVVRFDVPSRLLVANVDGTTLLVQTWAWTDDDLARVTSLATAFLDGVHFTAGATATVAPAPETEAASPDPTVRAINYFNRPFEYRVSPDQPVRPAYRDINLLGFTWHPAPASHSLSAAAEGAYRAADDGWGVVLFPAGGAMVHSCTGDGRVFVRDEPKDFIEDLRELGGIGVVDTVDRTFDGRPAVVARVDPTRQRCGVPDLHVDGASIGSGFVHLDLPSQLLATEVEGMTIVIQVWAKTEDVLDAAMPEAQAFLDGIHFTGPGIAP